MGVSVLGGYFWKACALTRPHRPHIGSLRPSHATFKTCFLGDCFTKGVIK